MSITEKTINIGKLQWFYREASGSSDNLPVLLLHGIPAHSFGWREVLSFLTKQGYRAIAPDWIGSGFSAKPERRDFAYTPEAYLAALAEFVAALELEQFHLVVQGFLGSVGLQYALAHPEQIERLIILNTPLSKTAKLPWQMKLWGTPFVGDMLTQDPLLVDRTLEKGSGFVIADDNLAIYRKPFLQSSAVGRALVATIKNLQLATVMAEIETGFSRWQKPTLLIWGMEDPWLPPTEAEQLAASRPNVEMIQLPEAKHYPQEHWSTEIGETIIYFFRRQVFAKD
ncbi:alpha/beta fold hydrolase [Pleurocapsales cyanobacterium LEGE 06147]|nr:alpha/beta fold hydrolase [Pleurocapsales cyanobacterium LEGE 06147]